MSLRKLLALALLYISCGRGAATLQGKVVGVADGDTMGVKTARITSE
jgi:hypothetical protein